MKFAPKIDLEDDEAGVEIPETDKTIECSDDAENSERDDEKYKQVLQEKFGHSEFRVGQMQAIKVVLEEERNALVVLATGGGKSLCYQFLT